VEPPWLARNQETSSDGSGDGKGKGGKSS
jgi:hypothetical protein